MTLDRYRSLELLASGGPITTSHAATRLRTSPSDASHTLSRLANRGLAFRIRPGLWHIGPGTPDPFGIAPALTDPAPAYVSFISALNYHGAIDQLPQEVEIASPSHARRIRTSLGTFVVRRIPPALFGGWAEESGRRVAAVGKALFDLAYVAAAAKRPVAIPELDLPERFDPHEATIWLQRVNDRALRTQTRRTLERLLARAGQ